ncbi:MAG: sulfur carrier protein ThiS adenylyltransferase ThiF [Spirochaetaceae bacterium]|nr:sulfur carrier protein ThiS adenylyltransferase ThiF [Spirochaetaceae bacterium]
MTRDEYRARLGRKSVGIAGAGGLGSNCAQALVRSGIGELVIADFDLVSESNLDRQFFFLDQVGKPKVEALAENLRRIDPRPNIAAHAIRLDPDSVVRLFADCDVIVEAFDLAEAKAMIIETVLTRLPGKALVSASGLAGFGRSESIAVRRSGDLVIVGDLESEVGPDNPPMAPRVGIAACMEANAVVEILLT